MTRRTNGEGSVYRRADGRWEAAAYVPASNGKRKRVRLYGRTRAEARTKLNAALANADCGIPVADRSWTIGQYLDYWMTDVVPHTRRPATISLYAGVVRNHLKPRLGTTSLTRLSATQLQQVLNQQLAEGHSHRVVGLTRTVLSAALTRAQREELVSRNVARLVELPTWQRKDKAPWTAQEVMQFLRVAKAHRLYPAFLMLAVYGLRRGEVLGLRVTDIDSDERVVRIRQQLQQIDNELRVGDVKTSAGRRDLPLIDIVWTALTKLERSPTGHELVFTSTNGQPIWPRNFVRLFHDLRKAANLRRITVHDLRHSAATLLKNLGVPARDAQLILGHAHITTTQQIYQHGDPAIQRAALTEVGRVLLSSADGNDSRQNQPSNGKTVVWHTSFQSGGTRGARTLDTLLKRSLHHPEQRTLISVVTHQRARTNAYVLGYVAVSSSRQEVL